MSIVREAVDESRSRLRRRQAEANRLRKVDRYCCGGGRKFRHVSQGKAEAARRSLIRRGLDRPREGRLVSYYCSRCLSWHVGHRGSSSQEDHG